ncbi:TPA: helix-turn-helix domain-containing protein [Bacillus paranthracis]|nr:helix-turn-helix domain-containing protein [Bacillus paranthracis]
MKELRKYSQFESVAEMDKSIEKYLTEYDLNERDRTVLWKVACYSVKFVGVSYLKVQTLADLTGYAKRTIQRSLKSLTELGILTRIDQMRTVQRGQGASITVINPFECHSPQAPLEEAVEPTEECVDEPSHGNESINFKAKTSIKKDYVEDMAHKLDQLVSNDIPVEFGTLALNYFDAAKVYKLWSKVQLVIKKHAYSVTNPTEFAISSLHSSILAKKMNRIRKDFTGYFYSTLVNKLSVAQRQITGFLKDVFL